MKLQWSTTDSGKLLIWPKLNTHHDQIHSSPKSFTYSMMGSVSKKCYFQRAVLKPHRIWKEYEIDIGLCIRKYLYTDDTPYHTDNNIQS